MSLKGLIFSSLSALEERRDYLTVFLIAFSARFLPELLSWPWLIGWDTPEYVANLRDFVARPNPIDRTIWYGGYRPLPPLLNVILYPLTFIIDPWYIYKLFPPILYGCEASAFYYLTEALKIDRRKRYVATLLFTFYPVSLRVSWDLHRNSLGILFLILLLAELIKGGESWRVAISSLGAILSHEITLMLAMPLLGFSVMRDLLRKNYGVMTVCKSLILVVGSTVSLLLLSGLGVSMVSSAVSLLFQGIDAVEVITTRVPPVALLFAPLLVFLPLGLRNLRDGYMLALLVLLLSGMGLIIWERWIYHLTIPLPIYASVGFSRMRRLAPLLTAMIVLSGLTFSSLPYERSPTSVGESSYSVSGSQVSSYSSPVDIRGAVASLRRIMNGTIMTFSMMHSSVPLSEEPDYLSASLYLADKRDFVILDLEAYGWVHMGRRFGSNVIPWLIGDNFEIPAPIVKFLRTNNASEFYILLRNGVELKTESHSYSIQVSDVKDFGSLMLYRCILTRVSEG
ncbi:MAG: hypothetical protein QXK42_01475 [Candidatus Korarchaeum sp.]